MKPTFAETSSRVASVGDLSFTWLCGLSAPVLVFDVPLTSARTVTVSRNGARGSLEPDARLRVVRTAASTGSDLTVVLDGTTLATLTSGEGWVEFAVTPARGLVKTGWAGSGGAGGANLSGTADPNGSVEGTVVNQIYLQMNAAGTKTVQVFKLIGDPGSTAWAGQV